MPARPPLTRSHALLRCAFVAVTGLIGAALLCAAALVPAPPAVLPLLVVVCVGSPMAAACELPGAIAVLRRRRGRRRALDSRSVEALPTTSDATG